MSDTMLFGVLRMPYELAMSDELSRLQFYGRSQQAADEIERLREELGHEESRVNDLMDDLHRLDVELSALRERMEEAPVAYIGVCSLNSAPQFTVTSSDSSWRGKRVRLVVCDE